MEIRQIRAFRTVADKKSFSQAAKTLGITQPTVSAQISALEKELETRLFERSARQTTVTESGKILYPYARHILNLAEEAQQALHQLKGLLRGHLIIGASTIPGEYILPRILHGFTERFPGVQVHVHIGDTQDIIRKVADNEVELGVVGARENNGRLTFSKFATDKLVLIAPARAAWLKQDTITLEELKRLPFIQRESGSGTREVAGQRLRALGVKENDLNVVLTLGSTAAVKEAVRCGAGVSIISRRAIEDEISLGLVREVSVQGLELSRDFFLVRRRQQSSSPATAAFLGFLTGGKDAT